MEDKSVKKRKVITKIIVMLLLFCSHQIFAASCGDVNSDGEVTIVDALLIAQHYVELDPENFDSTVADVDGDGGIDIVDALLVAQFYVGLITELSCPGGTPEPTSVPQTDPIWSGGPYSLNGTSDYVDVPAGLTNDLNDFSIACWVSLNSLDTWTRVFDFGSSTDVFMMLTPASGTTGYPYFCITTSGNDGEQGLNGTGALPTGSWQHLAATMSGDTGILYINGQEVDRNTGMTLNPADLGNTTNNYIGRSQWEHDPYLNASVDDFYVYDRALTSSEVSSLANNPPPTPAPTEPPPPVTGNYSPIAINDVRINSGVLRDAQDTNLSYLTSMDPERLLAPYRSEAGIYTSASYYPNWESDGLGGHIGGHYLSALSLMYAATGNSTMLNRLNSMINALEEVQNAHGNGYIGGIPNGRAGMDNVANGNISAGAFDLNGMWVPWYNLHKVFAGLRDAYLYAGNQKARTLLTKLGDWAIGIISGLSDYQVQTMLDCEHGGMNEVLADIYAITGDSKYLDAARRFSDNDILNALLARRDELSGKHANTQIPKVIGYERIGDLGNDQSWIDAADFFWDRVVNYRSISIGANSVSEHFQSDFSSMVTAVEGPETCNTHNMLRLTKALYRHSGSLHYIDYYERAMFNHILSSQHPDHGGLVYFTSMRPDHYRVYSTVDQSMWCCVGSGIENHCKYADMIYAENGDDFIVNLFVDSTVSWRDGISFTQTTDFPYSENSSITVNGSGTFVLSIRYPGWVTAGAMTLSINGQSQSISASPGQYIRINRSWSNGDVVEFSMPMRTTTMQLSGTNYYSLLHGPIVLGAERNPFPGEYLDYTANADRWAHIAGGQEADINAAPAFSGSAANFANAIVSAGSNLTFNTGNASLNTGQLTLIPFFRIHDTRYTVYFRQQ
jgi:uncharacterized protein